LKSKDVSVIIRTCFKAEFSDEISLKMIIFKKKLESLRAMGAPLPDSLAPMAGDLACKPPASKLSGFYKKEPQKNLAPLIFSADVLRSRSSERLK